jgi:hypothetical protein
VTRRAIFIFILVHSFAGLFAQLSAVKSYTIKKADSEIRVDGISAESVWATVPFAEGFRMMFPADTADATTQTRVKLLYDGEHIYVYAECDKHKGSRYVITSLKRDFALTSNDAFSVYFDTFGDYINGFRFSVNAYGAQEESLLQNGGNWGDEFRWDNKWWSAVKRHETGWTLEMKIPFKTLRYKPGNLNWRVNFARTDGQLNELSVWNPVPMVYSFSSLSHTGKLVWEKEPPKPGLNMAIIPYALGGFNHDYQTGKSRWNWGVGGDAKISVTPSLNLDLTVLPDFSQVDVDRQITNLTRFGLFFPEQRQFFIDNSDLFSRFGFSTIRPFFSRRIGLRDGLPVPILGGARLSGKINRNWRIGIMDIQTGGVKEKGWLPENFFTAAVQRQVFARSNIGLIFVNRQTFSNGRFSPYDYNRVIGLDFDLASKDNRWTGKFFFHHSFQPGTLKDSYAHASYLGYNVRKWSIMWNHEYVGKNYRADVGFVPRQSVYDAAKMEVKRVSFWRLEPSISYNIYPQNSSIFSITPGFYWNFYADSSFSANDVTYNPFLTIEFKNSASISFNYNENFTRLLFPSDITGNMGIPLPAGGYSYRSGTVRFNSNLRKRFNGNLRVSAGSFFNGRIAGISGGVNYRVQPWGNFTVDFSYDYVEFPQPFGIDRILLISPRLEFTPTNTLFITGFLQYNTQARNVNFNARIQWRYAPMSDLFLVYTENYGSDKLNILNRGVVLKCVYRFEPKFRKANSKRKGSV